MATKQQYFTERFQNEVEEILHLIERARAKADDIAWEYNALGANADAGPLGAPANWADLGLHFTRDDALNAITSLGQFNNLLNAGQRTNLYKIRR
jgi:hypothetical protein